MAELNMSVQYNVVLTKEEFLLVTKALRSCLDAEHEAEAEALARKLQLAKAGQIKQWAREADKLLKNIEGDYVIRLLTNQGETMGYYLADDAEPVEKVDAHRYKTEAEAKKVGESLEWENTCYHVERA